MLTRLRCQILWSRDPAVGEFLEEQADDDGIHLEKQYLFEYLAKELKCFQSSRQDHHCIFLQHPGVLSQCINSKYSSEQI